MDAGALAMLDSIGEDFLDDEYDEGEEEDEDYDTKAREMAQRLEEQLLADIAKAQLEAVASTRALHEVQPRASTLQEKRETALATMEAIIAFAAKHPLVSSIISAARAPDGVGLLDTFSRCVHTSSLPKARARLLSQIVLSLARSEALSVSPRPADPPPSTHDTGKRKRDERDDGDREAIPHKRIAFDQPDLLLQIGEAVRAISTTFTLPANQGRLLNPALVSSIQYPLHQVFLFSVTSASRATDGRHHALQELGGLVQMIGVLSGVPIGSNPAAPRPPHAPAWAAPPLPPDIGAAVYPCLVTNCGKTFHRLYYLRTHQRLHTLVDRPYRCTQCPASFARNHDLKRHSKLHDKKAWRCAGCNKIFSRRDAIKRHKDNRARPGGRPRTEADAADFACQYADVEEVEVEKFDGDEEASRRAKLWSGIVANQMAGGSGAAELAAPEEGEVDPAVIQQSHASVLQLLPLLQAEVARALGGTSGPPAALPLAQNAQTTLASIIAQAQEAPIALPATASPSSRTGPHPEASVESSSSTTDQPTSASLSLSSWLSEEQTKMLELAIAEAASAAQAQAEAEAELEEEDEDEAFDDDDEEDGVDDE